jgi:hypothetical protein
MGSLFLVGSMKPYRRLGMYVSAAQWSSVCLACASPWVLYLQTTIKILHTWACLQPLAKLTYLLPQHISSHLQVCT